MNDQMIQLRNALTVLVLTPHIREYLEANDPKAIEQARFALDDGIDAPVTRTRREAVDALIANPPTHRNGKPVLNTYVFKWGKVKLTGKGVSREEAEADVRKASGVYGSMRLIGVTAGKAKA